MFPDPGRLVTGVSSAVENDPMVLVICGPIASGKSTLARAVAQLFERQGADVTAVDLDLVYEFFERGAPKASAPTWRRARRTAAGLTDVLLGEDVGVVVVEGDFLTAEEREEYLTALRSAVVPLFVTLKVSVDVALQRVEQDATRRISRDPEFLRRHYEQMREAIRVRPATDFVLDTSLVSVDEAARTIVEWASAGAATT
jgi:chloramphenicol 3-O-phosphotransferase